MLRLTFLFSISACVLFSSPIPSRAQTKKNSQTTTPSDHTGQEIIGKRVIFVDGQTLDVDDAWKSGESIWVKRNGTSQMLSRPVKRVEDRFKTDRKSTRLNSSHRT